jgi:transcriptional regulator with XRE-family HTH domain
MTQQELVRTIEQENGTGKKANKATISQSYLSQIESGARPHLTNTTRLLLAKFFKVHPGYLVDDPEGYHSELLSDLRTIEDKLDLWLIGGAERFRHDPALCQSLLTLANHTDTRRCFLVIEAIIETPALLDRLFQVLRPEAPSCQATTQPALKKTAKRSTK